MDTATARTRLEQLLDELDRSIATLEGEHAGESSELSSYDQHPADVASDYVDADREEAVIASASRQRDQVRAALQRLEDGSYGRCVDCGEPLSDERLEARPEAARCLTDQARQEAR